MCVGVEGSRRSEDEEITAVLKQTISVASGCQETRRPHGDVSVTRSGVGRGQVLWASRAAMRSPRGDRRALCTLRDALPVWDVGKGGLMVDCEIVSSGATSTLFAHVSQGSEGPQVVTLVSEN